MMWSKVCAYVCDMRADACVVWRDGMEVRLAFIAGLTVWYLGLPRLQLPPKRDVVPLLRMKVADTSSYMGKTPSGTSVA